MTLSRNGQSNKRPLQSALAHQRYVKMRDWWRQLMMIDVKRPELGSWPEAAPRHHQPWGMGCRVCRESVQTWSAGRNTCAGVVAYRWVSFGVCGPNVNTQSIRMHMTRRHHLVAMACLTGGKVHAAGSPHLDELLQIIQDSRQGRSHSASSSIAH